MIGFLQRRSKKQERAPGPVLDLSGPILRRAMEHLVQSAEPSGGVERYVSALVLKASLFQEVLAKGKIADLSLDEFRDLAAFVTPARRRIAPYLTGPEFVRLKGRVATLLEGWSDLDTADARLELFVRGFPQDKAHRWVRDLGAELLHFAAPDHYPLMTRWMWDRRVGTGVLREIWFRRADGTEEDVGVDDDFATFSKLYEELGSFLAENGVFRDHVFYTDLLCAHVYADYINDQGGAYLKSDFSEGVDPMLHTRRLLGLDAINTETGRTRLKLIDGDVHVMGGPSAMLN